MARYQIQIKSPESLHYVCQDLTEDEAARLKEVARKFFKYDENLTLEIDTEKETCIVLEKK